MGRNTVIGLMCYVTYFVRTYQLFVLLTLCLLLTACGGGGGGGGGGGSTTTGGTTVVPPPTTMVDTHSGTITYSEYLNRRNVLASQYRSAAGFANQNGLSLIKADVALANLNLKRGSTAADAPGSGITVGVIDSGIDTSSPAFSQNLVSERFANGAQDESPQTFSSINSYSHGTAVASVIGSRNSASVWSDMARQNTHFHGVAWGVNLDVTAIPLGSGGGTYQPVSLSTLGNSDSSLQGIFSSALGGNPDFLNLSWGYNGIIDVFTEQELRLNLPLTISTIAQSGSTQKTIFVWAAGNAADDTSCNPNGRPNACRNNRPNAASPEILAGMMARISELQGHSIAVVSVDSGGTISSFSNRCGIAANWCIAAPGQDISVIGYVAAEDPNNPGQVSSTLVRRGLLTLRGTSFAAPFVTGGLALMKHVFRSQLSNTQLVTRLFATANKRGKYASTTTYGQGLMDLGAATSIVGNPVISASDSVNSNGFPLFDTSANLGTAFGDSLHQSLSGQEIMALDQLHAPFWFDLSDFVGSGKSNGLSDAVKSSFIDSQARIYSNGLSAESWKFSPTLPRFRSGSRNGSKAASELALLRFANGASSSHLGLANGAVATSYRSGTDAVVTAFKSPHSESQKYPVSGVTLSYSPPLAIPTYMTVGAISEGKSLLRSKSSGAFGKLTGNSVFFGAGTGAEFRGWQISGEAEMGLMNPKISSGIIRKMSPLVTSAFSIQSTKKFESQNSLTFDMSQKLRVESGKAELSVPVSRTYEGEVLRSEYDAGLSPSGREINYTVRWDRSLNQHGHFSLEGTLIKEPGHVRDARQKTRLIAAWSQRF